MVYDFAKFNVWQKAMALAHDIHRHTKVFPSDERYGMTSQMRRAALSVAANIAEGFGRYTYPDKMHKYVQARGELVELMTFLHHAMSIGYMKEAVFQEAMRMSVDIHKMLNALIAKMDRLEKSAVSRSPKS